jgi:acyl carrier protein
MSTSPETSTVGAEEARAAVRTKILDFCGPSLAAYGVDPATAADDLDLRACGAIDSLRFIELVVELEETFGVEIELEDVDPEKLTLLGTLCDQVAPRIEALPKASL